MSRALTIIVPSGAKKISIYRERKATKAERKKDRVRVMAEWVHVYFGSGNPRVAIVRDLTE